MQKVMGLLVSSGAAQGPWQCPENVLMVASSMTLLLSLCFCQEPGNKQAGYNMHQLHGNKQYGTEKSGTLYKKSDG